MKLKQYQQDEIDRIFKEGSEIELPVGLGKYPQQFGRINRTNIKKVSKMTKYTVELTEEQMRKLGLPVKDKSWPQKGDKYYYFNEGGLVYCELWEDLGSERLTKSQGNIFRTKEEAKAESERRAIMQELRECEGVDPLTPTMHTRCTISYCLAECKFKVMFTTGWVNMHEVRFEAERHAQAAITKLGDTKLRKLFGLEV